MLEEPPAVNETVWGDEYVPPPGLDVGGAMTTPLTELFNPLVNVPVTSEARATLPSTNMEIMEAMMAEGISFFEIMFFMFVMIRIYKY